MRYLICLLALVCSLHAAAQNDETVYRLELGGGVGMGLNLTDVDGKIGLAAAAVARFPLNPRMAVKAQFSYSQIKGATDGIKNFYPIDPSQPGSDRLHYEVSDGIYDLSALYELHFLPYGYVRDYKGYSRIVPYLQMVFISETG